MEMLLQNLDAGYGLYLADAEVRFGVRFGDRHDFQSLRDAVVALSGEALEMVLADKGAGELMLGCLQDIGDNPVLAAQLAQVARSDSNPRFMKDYLRTWCATMLGDPYSSRGKVPARQVKVGRGKGDLVVSRKGVWLASDTGFTGHRNGYVDPGELFALKLAVLNKSRTTPHLSASARLVLLDDKGRPCPFSTTGAPVQNVPGECRIASVVSQRVVLPELSPGEQATAGPFNVMLHPDVKGDVSLRFALEVEASGLKPSRTAMTLKAQALPGVALAGVKVDDDATGGSKGNNNGRIEPGERIELRTKLALSNRKLLSKVGIRARQYSQFLDVAGKNLGLTSLRKGRPAQVAGDFEFDVPSIEKMGEIPNDGPNREFFTDRKVALWFAAAGCAGKVRLDKKWTSSVPDSYLCPYTAPGYRFVVNAQMPIVFGQVFMIVSDPPGADISINGFNVGRPGPDQPVVFARVEPVRNSIVYYTIVARKQGFRVTELKVPVIHKDQSAGNLTVDYVMKMETTAPPPPDDPPEPFLTSRIEKKKEEQVEERVDPVELWGRNALGEEKPKAAKPSEPDKRDGRFRVFAGGSVRWFSPVFQNEPGTDKASIYDLNQEDSPPFMGGFELGGEYLIISGLHVFLTGQMFFSTGDPALSYFSNGADQLGNLYQNGDGTSTQLKTDVPAFTNYSVTLGPGYELALGPVLLSARMGLVLEGLTADAARLDQGKSGVPYSKLEPFLVGGRGDIGIGIDTSTGLIPYIRAFTIFPREYFDWGLSLGLEYQI